MTKTIKSIAVTVIAVLIFFTALTAFSAKIFVKADNIVSDEYSFVDYAGEATFSLYLTADGKLYSAGSGTRGQLGLGNFSNVKRFEPNFVLDNIKMIETGREDYSIAVTSGNKIFTWGSNKYGQLGSGSGFNDDANSNATNRPSEIFISGAGIINKVSAGLAHTLVLSDGKVYAFGANDAGQLGLGGEINRKACVGTPTQIPSQSFGDQNIIDIATTEYASFALTEKGEIYAFGSNDRGQLGIGNTNVANNNFNTPQKINGLTNVKKISARTENVLALTEAGKVYGWGSNFFKQLGIADFAEKYAVSPQEITNLWLMSGEKVEASENFGAFKQVADNEKTPTLKKAGGAIKFADIACGGITNFVLDDKGGVYSFGQANYANVGYSIQDLKLEGNHPMVADGKVIEPLKIKFYEPRNIKEDTLNDELDESVKNRLPINMDKEINVKIDKLVRSIGSRTFVLDEEGNMWSWGDNSEAQVCSGDVNLAVAPVRSTLFRNRNFDATLKQKNYLLKPMIITCVILGLGLAFLIYLEIKNHAFYKAEAQAAKNDKLRRKGKLTT